MRSITAENSDQLHLRKFWPVDRNSPIFEGVVSSDVLFDVAREGKTFNVAFHASISGFLIASDVLTSAIESAVTMIVEAERESEELR
jgi:hypothetical protein